MNGATAEPCDKTSKPPNIENIIIIGKSQNFFLIFRNIKISFINSINVLLPPSNYPSTFRIGSWSNPGAAQEAQHRSNKTWSTRFVLNATGLSWTISLIIPSALPWERTTLLTLQGLQFYEVTGRIKTKVDSRDGADGEMLTLWGETHPQRLRSNIQEHGPARDRRHQARRKP